MTVRKGQVWTVRDEPAMRMLVVSGNFYNDTGSAWIVPVRGADGTGLSMPVGEQMWAEADNPVRVRSGVFGDLVGVVDVQALTDLHNMMFRIIARP